MKFIKILLSFFFCILSVQLNSQTITVDDTRSANDLVNLLIGNSCAVTSNINISSNQSVAYFNQNGSTFPIKEGVIIRSGIAAHTQGSYTGNNLDSQVNTNSDADLQQISNNSGQIAQITDVASLDFDFIPPSTDFSFNFLFSSNEYGEWQCGFSDVFAFVLTDLITGEKINLAVVPTSGNPISIKEIRDNQYNSSCNSVNPELFSTYNVDNPATSTINMRGHTVVMNASATIKPNNPYNIKLVIGDYNDSKYDSAVFIEAGSFGNFLSLGDDFSICNGESFLVDSGFTNTTDYTYEWRRNNVVIPGETNPTLNVTQSGTYDLNITFNSSSCTITDQIVVSDLTITNPPDLVACDLGTNTRFDLTQNNITTLGLDPSVYSLEYFSSVDNLNNNIPIDNALLTNYQSVGGVTIYGKITNSISSNSCTQTISFQLNTNSITATKPADLTICENDAVNLRLHVDLQILNGLNPNNHTVTYYLTQQEAENNQNPIADPTNFSVNSTNTINLWARLSENSGTECSDITDFNILVNPNPLVDQLDNVYACSSFVLQPLTNGNYFTGPNGTGNQLNAGDTIHDSTVLYVYTIDNGCSSETTFTITLVEEYDFETEACGEYIVPNPDVGDFYTAPNGPNGTGNIIPKGSTLNTSQTIYFYSEFDNTVCTDNQLDIIVHPLPPVDTLNDVTTCNTFTLPTLTNGNYFTGINGTGTQLNAGENITTSQTIYIYNRDVNTCESQTSFTVTIIDLSMYQDTTVCGSYTVPTTTIGNFFTQANGQGIQLNAGDELTTSQTIYFYAQTDNGCADNVPMNITVNPLPPVDTLNDVVTCIDNPMSLPPLTNGNYFTQSGGLGTQLNAGDVITSTQTIFIYNFDGTCPNETSFTVEVRPLPPINSFTDIFSCEPYTLPIIANGKYYSQSGGLGTELLPGDVISSTQTIYVYNEYADLQACNNEAFFTIYISGVEVDKPNDVNVCDSYTLPTLTSGNYFTGPNGSGTQLNAGDVITNTQSIYIYRDNASRFFCSDEHQFTITISETPTLPVYPNVESCDSYTLPNLNLPGYTINYYRQPNKVDLISPSDYTITTIGTQTIYVHAFANGNESCSDETQFELTIYPLLDLSIEGGIICVDAETRQTLDPYKLQSGLDPAEFTVNWYFDNQLVGTGPNHSATRAGTYTVETIKLIPDVGPNCNYNPTQVVVRESVPKAKVTFLTESFQAPANIRIDMVDEGLGRYQYRLDNGTYQTSNLFHDLDYGAHTVYVRDVSGICSNPLVLNFKVINHPNFFTPNEDGENETWNIPDLANHPEAEITIYDRYGKEITKIKPTGRGWDGNYKNGAKAPSTDYWFMVTFLYQGTPTSYSSNFSLIRRE
jgi:gliding motility-associated-like protein